MKHLLTVIIIFFVIFNSRGQNITNTLGSLGNFTIKDASNTYMSLSQSTGNLSLNRGLNLLLTSSATTGIIFKGGTRFIHDFAPPGAFGSNVFIGIGAGNFTMVFTGNTLNSSFNTSVGSSTLASLTSGANNSAFGYTSMFDNTSGNNNSAFGHSSLNNNTTGGSNSSFGFESLFNNFSASSNLSFGYQNLKANTTGDQNSAFGSQSMWTNSTGSFNCSFGFQSLLGNTTASRSSAFGYQSLTSNNGINNNAFGYQSLQLSNGGVENCAFGNLSLVNNSNGSQNSAFGNNTLTSNTTGLNNSAFGNDAGTNVTTGSNLTLIGFNAEPTSGIATNQVTLGNSFVSSLRCAVTTITSLSDARDKKNIHDLNLGLGFISKLKPRIYNWDKREWYDNNVSDGSKMQETPTAGFIAQELDEAQTSENAEWLRLVLKDNHEKWEATPGNLLPIMVKAIQELNEKCDSLQNENNILASKLDEVGELKKKLEMLTFQIENLNIKTDEIKRSSDNIKREENNLQVISNENSK
ncbi:MAG: tail fiber domain-containing protein [Ignavibacteria bacterium]